MHVRDVVILAGWLAFALAAPMALGVWVGIMVVGLVTIALGLFALKEAE